MSKPLPTMTDEELLGCFAVGSEEAFSLLVQRHSGMLKAEAARCRGQGAEADDLAQETLLGLLGAAKSYRTDGSASFATYARVCVRNRLLNAVRRMPSAELPTDTLPEEETQEGNPERLLIEQEEAQAFRRRLHRLLTEREYRVLMLHLASFSYEEMASALHISRKAADNALQRAKRKLMTVSWRI